MRVTKPWPIGRCLTSLDNVRCDLSVEALTWLWIEREAAQRIRATQNLMHARGMTEEANYRELLTRLSTALAMTEAAYVEAKRRRDL